MVFLTFLCPAWFWVRTVHLLRFLLLSDKPMFLFPVAPGFYAVTSALQPKVEMSPCCSLCLWCCNKAFLISATPSPAPPTPFTKFPFLKVLFFVRETT